MNSILTMMIIVLFLLFQLVSCENLLFFMADDLNPLIHPYYEQPYTNSPNLKQFAKSATVFNNYYSSVPLCNPARTAMWYGLEPTITNVYENYDRSIYEDPDLKNRNLHYTLKSNGYQVIGVGKLYHDTAIHDVIDGFDYYLNIEQEKPHAYPYGNRPKTRLDYFYDKCPRIFIDEIDGTEDETMNEVVWVEQFLIPLLEGTGPIQLVEPWAIFFGAYKPHKPRDIPEQYFDVFGKMPQCPILTSQEEYEALSELGKQYIDIRQEDYEAVFDPAEKYNFWSSEFHAYKAAVTYIDNLFGRVLYVLNDTNTHIFFTSDHGYIHGDKKWFGKKAPWRDVVQTPLLVKLAGQVNLNVVNNIYSSIDIYPTIVELLELDLPQNVQLHGHSFASNILSEIYDPQSYAIVSVRNNEKNNTVKADGFFYKKWHLIIFTDTYTNNINYELYNLNNDPHEINNLAYTMVDKVQDLLNLYNEKIMWINQL